MVQFKAFRNQAKSFHSVNYVNINYSIKKTVDWKYLLFIQDFSFKMLQING